MSISFLSWLAPSANICCGDRKHSRIFTFHATTIDGPSSGVAHEANVDVARVVAIQGLFRPCYPSPVCGVCQMRDIVFVVIVELRTCLLLFLVLYRRPEASTQGVLPMVCRINKSIRSASPDGSTKGHPLTSIAAILRPASTLRLAILGGATQFFRRSCAVLGK